MEEERDNKRRTVFSSNWSQPNNQLQENGNIVNNGRVLLSNQFPSNPNPNHHHHVTATVVLPARLGGSMAERARQANAPPPPGALPCPRCDSTNTKFCYYNNYNLNQPRYSCKACRRYWTRGGTLRNVPIGGGSRKNNKKGKNGNSKTPSTSSKHSSSTVNVTSQHGHDSSSGQLTTNQQFPFSTPTLHSLTQIGGIGLNLTATNGHNQTHHDQIGSTLMNNLGFHNNNDNNLMSHFPLFDPYGYEGNIGTSFSSTSMVDSRVYHAADPVKMEEQTNLVNVTRPVSGLMSTVNQTNQYYWNNNSDFSGPSSNDNHHDDQLM
ncbi:unnamed protein product [Cochlearia groenlandica]